LNGRARLKLFGQWIGEMEAALLRELARTKCWRSAWENLGMTRRGHIESKLNALNAATGYRLWSPGLSNVNTELLREIADRVFEARKMAKELERKIMGDVLD